MNDSSWDKAERVFDGIIQHNGKNVLDAIGEIMKASAEFNGVIQDFVEKASRQEVKIEDFPAIFALVGWLDGKQVKTSVSMVGNPKAMIGNWKSALRVLRDQIGDAGLMEMVGEVLEGEDGGKEIDRTDETRPTSNIIDFPNGRTLH